MHGESRFLTTLTARDVTDPGPVPIRVLDSGLLMGGTVASGSVGAWAGNRPCLPDTFHGWHVYVYAGYGEGVPSITPTSFGECSLTDADHPVRSVTVSTLVLPDPSEEFLHALARDFEGYVSV